jgi:uncharacterized protein GlcG (DUF336 family)
MKDLKMFKTQSLGLAILFAILLGAVSSVVYARAVITERALALDGTGSIAEATLEKCRADGNHNSITMIDSKGKLKGVLHDEGAAPRTIDFSLHKLCTALTFRRSSGETGKIWADNPPTPNIEGTAGTGGSCPGMEVIGAIDVSAFPGAIKMNGVPTRVFQDRGPSQGVHFAYP